MKIILLLFVLLPVLAYAKGQRKIDTTPNAGEGEWTFQVEQNYYHNPNQTSPAGNALPVDTYYINASLDYSFENGSDIQIATYNCPVAGGGAQNYQCDSYINLSQTLDITDDWQALIGSQNGTVFSGPMKWHNADYALAVYQPDDTLNLHAGPYFVDKDLATTTNTVGYTGGLLIKYLESWQLQADYFSGHNNISGANINVFWKQYYVGVGVPEHNSGNEFYGIVGFKAIFK
ncbi:hypothetical protein [Methylomonas sp. AM2-LC]|uniref:hypothetical protein n=1 Tax=Methylomonas sp. AM2-LC TaxID=3153301 RepID=UPI003264C9CC